VQTRTSGHREDALTGAIESQTSRIPSSGFLAAAIGSMAVSALLQVRGKPNAALFVGQWAPALLILGLYNKVVKQHGSDVSSRNEGSQQGHAERARSASA